jgi:hypothetical protein
MERLKENLPNLLEYIRQVHEEWLTQLEGLAVEAIACMEVKPKALLENFSTSCIILVSLTDRE